MYDLTTGTWTLTPELERLIAEKKSANELQNRKHEDWDDNYTLYRNKVKTNRLTQRQAVNIPLMKETVKTLLSKIDDPPNVDWQEVSGDEDKELIYQEVWNDNSRRNKLELVDVLDKKNVLLYGIGTKKLNIAKDGVIADALDVYDVTFDPLMKAGDVESARFIIHQNIFKSVREILADDRYSKEGKDMLKQWINAPSGVTQSAENKEQYEKKMERMKAMGIDHGDFPLFAGGDRLINLTEHYYTYWNTKKKDWQRRVCVYADNSVLLMNESLYDLIGCDFWPFVVWSEDPETNDLYPDSIADLVRTPNKVLNVWFSQLIENRTLKNFQMHWFLPTQGYTPQTYTPGQGMMLPAPPGDDINKVIKPVDISGLDDTLEAINAVTQIVERGSGAVAIDKGQAEQGTQTLGEVQILVGKAMERTTAMAKFYRMAWYEYCWKWDKMMHANAPKFLKLYKKSRSGKLYPKRVYAGDWKSDMGYEPAISSSSEQEAETIKGIQKWLFAKSQFPGNPAIAKIAAKRIFEGLDVTPEELKEIEEGEKQAQQAQLTQPEIAPQPPSGMEDMLAQSIAQAGSL